MTPRTPSNSRSTALALTAVVALAFFGNACGSSDDDAADVKPAATTAATQPATDASPASETSTPATADGATINTADAGVLGTILTTADGLTLYTFKNDAAGTDKSACEGGCAAAWPALTVEGAPTAGDGITGELGTLTRTDGARQVTYEGRPLYRFVNDAAPGDTNGQNVGSVWFVAQP
jgi:predicted lipoprotein with Yx(FWY)xxD motif